MINPIFRTQNLDKLIADMDGMAQKEGLGVVASEAAGRNGVGT